MILLVTGGYGQIGSHVIDNEINNFEKVISLDNLSTGKIYHLKNYKNLININCDISDTQKIIEIFKEHKPNYVVHCAGSYKDPSDWQTDILTNCLGSANIIKSSMLLNVKRFIYFQTSLCYGLKNSSELIKIDHLRQPESSSYSISKTTAEYYLELSGLNYVTFRLANVIGPRNLAGALPIFYKRLKNKEKIFVSESRRDFVSASDLSQIVSKALQGYGSGAYHFSSGKDVAINELLNLVLNNFKPNYNPEIQTIPLQKDDTKTILLDPTKTLKDFGTIKFQSINEIVSNAIEYYHQYGVSDEYTHLKINKQKK